MGTRNLTMVIFQEKTRVAQYGQWDGYPSGQGTTILKFLINTLLTGKKMSAFKTQLLKCQFNGPVQEIERQKFLVRIGVKEGWMNGKQADKYHAAYPLSDRDIGAGILDLILHSKEKIIWLDDSTSFAANSLFCEYAYVVDFDKNTFEVYDGFNTSPVPPGQRFSEMSAQKLERRGDNQYYPVTLVKSYSLTDLPNIKKFLKDCEEDVEEEVT